MSSTYEKLDKRFAYIRANGGEPIRKPSQVPQTKIINASKQKSLENQNIKCLFMSQKNSDMIDAILPFGGNTVLIPDDFEEDAEAITNRGQLWLGDKVIMMEGRPSKCHANTCDLYLANKDAFEVAIATGYAVLKDGIWRQHSWLVKKNGRSVSVIETTQKRLAYFGFVMTPDEAEQFCEDNF